MQTKLTLLGLVLLALALLVNFLGPTNELYSPLSLSSSSNPGQQKSQEYVILGFAPYWNIKKIRPESYDVITHFAYFNLHLNSDGTLFTHVNKKEQDPGYTSYNRLISGTLNIPQKPLILTFMPESQTALTTILSTQKNRASTIKTIVDLLKESGSKGVNIDFEPLGDTLSTTRANFTSFIMELKSALHGTSSPLLTISIYASAGSRPRLWDLPQLAPLVDYFVVMTYDYTMPGSLSSGPNSPLRGSGDLFDHDITKNIAEISKLIPPRKILLGLPFYGYEWNTLDDSKYSQAQGKGSVASLERIDELINNKDLELLWDRNTLTPYGISTTSGQISQFYFENETSMKLKIDFVKSAGLGGVAIWALGYEGAGNWVWPVIKTLSR